MKFKINEDLKKVADAMTLKKGYEVVSRELCGKFMEAGLLLDDPTREYGLTVEDDLAESYKGEICRILIDYLCVPVIEDDIYEAMLKVIVLGEGDCPYCGGTMKLVEEKCHEVTSWRNEFPPEVITDEEVWKCDVCDYEKTIIF